MENIIAHLCETYDPTGMILYGSYRDGTQNEQSDFDALLLTCGGGYTHDTSVVDGVRLDVFVYPEDSTTKPEDFIQLYDGAVVIDETGSAAALMCKVRQYVDGFPRKTPEEKAELRNWCEKMLMRAERSDAEGLYRGHWLLTDSLQIYCDIRDRFYFGPKKTMLRMQADDPHGFSLLCHAMEGRNHLEPWIKYIFENK